MHIVNCSHNSMIIVMSLYSNSLIVPAYSTADSPPSITFNLEVGFNMTYLMAPWMFSVQLASQVT